MDVILLYQGENMNRFWGLSVKFIIILILLASLGGCKKSSDISSSREGATTVSGSQSLKDDSESLAV